VVAGIGVAATAVVAHAANAEGPSAFGGDFDLQDFYRPFTLEEITPQNMQKWPYNKYVSANWDKYVTTSSAKVERAKTPTELQQSDKRFDLNGEFKNGKSFLQSLIDTQVKGFVVLKDGEILAEYYDNGFNVDQTNLLQSASKTFAGVITHKLIDEGKLDPNARVDSILPDFKGTTIGNATVQQVLDMTTGAPTLLDFHTPGTPDAQWEVEIGLQKGEPQGHVKLLKTVRKAAEPGAEWNYTDKNTDTLALLAEKVTGKKYADLVSELFNDFGAIDEGSIALTSDGTASPSYGISISTRDYALFHQWLAQRKAPKSFYGSAMDKSKDLITKNKLAAPNFPGTTYGSQTYYMPQENLLFSSGSYGQIGFSDMEGGTSVVMHADWANNAEPDKFAESRARAIAIVQALRKN
jgi:CubicO group peptidase (beta-lactamase class C family)